MSLTLADWARLLGALTAASFWALGPGERRLGLDGSDWLIEGADSFPVLEKSLSPPIARSVNLFRNR
jgi:hypothetical protein